MSKILFQVLLDNWNECSPVGAHFLGDFPHVFAEVLFDDLGNVGEELGHPGGERALLMSLAFCAEIVQKHYKALQDRRP